MMNYRSELRKDAPLKLFEGLAFLGKNPKGATPGLSPLEIDPGNFHDFFNKFFIMIGTIPALDIPLHYLEPNKNSLSFKKSLKTLEE